MLNVLVTNKNPPPYHPACTLIPEMSPDQYAALVEDIRANGLLDDIDIMPDGAILDGRHRHRACLDIGIEPRFRVYTGDSPYQFVFSKNANRRHWDASIAATVAVDFLPVLEEEGRERKRQAVINRHANDNGLDEELVPHLEERAPQSRDIAGDMLGVSGRYVSEAKRLKRDAPDLFEEVRTGGMKLAQAKRELETRNDPSIMRSSTGKNLDAMMTSTSNEWYTTKRIIDAVTAVMGGIDLDPASCEEANKTVRADNYYTIDDDGLSQKWHGRVYLNPPFGDQIPKWVDKINLEYDNGNIDQAILLLPARPDTKWFRALNRWTRCFIFGRVRFNGHKNSAPFPTMLVNIGCDSDTFNDIMSELGDIYRCTHSKKA